MTDVKNGSGADPLLLQITATLAEIKQAQVQHGETLQGIQQDIRQFDVKIVALQKDMESAKEDIAKRTHKEDTQRLKDDIRELEQKLDDKPSKWFARTVVGLLVTEFLVVVGAALKLSLFP